MTKLGIRMREGIEDDTMIFALNNWKDDVPSAKLRTVKCQLRRTGIQCLGLSYSRKT